MRAKASFIGSVVILALFALAPSALAAAPVNTGAPRVSGSATVGVTLKTTNGEWSTSPAYFAYEWWSCAPTGPSSCQPTKVSIDATYTIRTSDVGADIYVAIVAYSASKEPSEAAVSDSLGPIARAGTPINLSAPILSGNPSVGGTVTATNGGWTDAQSISLQWYECDARSYGGCALKSSSVIPGATSATYSPTEDDVGYDLFVTATGHNAVGDSTPVVSNRVGPVTSSAGPVPSNETVPEIRGTATVGSRLTVSTGDWDGAPDDYAYEWRRCSVPTSSPSDVVSQARMSCVVIAGQTKPTYVLTSSELGRLMMAGVKAHNDAGWSEQESSEPIGPIKPAGTIPVIPQQPPQVKTSGKVVTVASGKTFAITPAVRVSCASDGRACAVDLRATTRARVKVHRAFVWRAIAVAHVHFTLGAGSHG
jgi:large repetitive protein